MTLKIQHRYVTLLTAILAYFSNSFTFTLPYVISEVPFVDLQHSPQSTVEANTMLIICQHLGILAGALFFSFWVDKKGRLFILLISVFTYSFGTFLGGLVDNYYWFLGLRFVVGFGLAPELGIGIVLISEIFARNKTSLYVAMIAIFGFLAVIILNITGKYFYWRDIYFSVGIIGLIIMITRFASFESDLFTKIKKEYYQTNALLSTIKSPNFLWLILCMLPVYVITACSTFVISGLEEVGNVTLKKEIMIIMYSSSAILGFVAMPILSYYFRSRLLIFKISIISLLINALLTLLYLQSSRNHELLALYGIIISNGLFSGYLFEFFIYALEQFGTNRRGSATTLLFAFGRSSVFMFSILIPVFNAHIFKNILNTLLFLEILVFSLAIWAIVHLRETFNKDLDFTD
jgi:MFS family permease